MLGRENYTQGKIGSPKHLNTKLCLTNVIWKYLWGEHPCSIHKCEVEKSLRKFPRAIVYEFPAIHVGEKRTFSTAAACAANLCTGGRGSGCAAYCSHVITTTGILGWRLNGKDHSRAEIRSRLTTEPVPQLKDEGG
jgi:hypothetical protein